MDDGPPEPSADELESRLRESWTRARAGLGLFMIASGTLGSVGVLAFPESRFLALRSPVTMWGVAILLIVVGVYVLRVGLPGERAGGAVPVRALAHVSRWVIPIVVLILAWPLGIYRGAWIRWTLSGSPCEDLLPIHEIETLGVRRAAVLRAEAGPHCLVELEPEPGSRDLASLQLLVEPGTREQASRRAGRRAEPLPALGESAWRIRYAAGQRLIIFEGGHVATLQLAAAAWNGAATARLIEHLARTRASLAAPP